MWDKHHFFLVNNNTYYNTHENSNISFLNRVYNTITQSEYDNKRT